MIKINLIDDSDDGSFNAIVQLVLFGVSLVVIVLSFVIFSHNLGYDTQLLTREQEMLRDELVSLKETTREVRGLEKKRETLKRKIDIIQTLKKRKTGPVRVLDDFNISLPEKSWITELRENSSVLRIVGLALDNQTIADLMKELQSSPYFIKVDLVETRQVTWRNVKMKRFTLSAKVTYSGEGDIESKEDAA